MDSTWPKLPVIPKSYHTTRSDAVGIAGPLTSRRRHVSGEPVAKAKWRKGKHTTVAPSTTAPTAPLGFHKVPMLPLDAEPLEVGQYDELRKNEDREEIALQREQAVSRENFISWMQSYNAEMDNFQSTALFCEVVLNQVMSATANLPDPNTLRVTICSVLFEHMIPLVCSRYQGVFNTIKTQLFQGLLLPPNNNTDSNSPRVAKMFDVSTIPNLLQLPPESAGRMKKLIGRQFYFEQNKELSHKLTITQGRNKALQSTMEKQNVIIQRSIGQWQTIYVQRIFIAWRNWHREKRRNDFIKSRRIDRFTAEIDTHRLELAFTRWRLNVAFEILRRLRERETHLQYQISNSKSQFSLQCFKTDKYLRTIEDLRREIIDLQNTLDDTKKAQRTAEDALATQTQESNKLWTGRLQKMYSAIADYSTLCNQLLTSRAVEDRLQIDTIMPASMMVKSKGDRKKRKLAKWNQTPNTSDAEEVLLRWSNTILQKAHLYKGTIQNFSSDWTDGEAFIVIMNALCPHVCSLRPLKETEAYKRCELILNNFAKLNITGLVKPQDILDGTADLIMVLLSELFWKYATNSFPDHWSSRQHSENQFEKSLNRIESVRDLVPLAQRRHKQLQEEEEEREEREREKESSLVTSSSTASIIPQPPMGAPTSINPRSSVANGEPSGPKKPGSKPNTPGGRPGMDLEDGKKRTSSTGPRPYSRDKQRPSTADSDDDFRVGEKAPRHQKMPTTMDAETLQAYMAEIRSDMKTLQESYDNVQEEQKQWLRLAELVSDYAKFLLKRRAEGMPVVPADIRDYAKFTKVPKAHLKDLATKYNAATWDEQVEGTQKILKLFYPDLRRIFLHYSSLISADSNMSYQEFWRFVIDCRLPDKSLLTKNVIDEIFLVANSEIKGEDGGADTAMDYMLRGDDPNPDSELVPNEFVECLIRMAEIKFPKHPTTILRFQYLIQHFVIPRAAKSDIDKFRREIYTPETQQVMKKYSMDLYRIFNWYSKMDKRSRMCRTLNCHEFTMLLRDMGMLDSVLNESAVSTIFNSVQSDEGHDDNSEFVFTEFVEGIAAVCVYKNPAPFVPLEKRFDTFLGSQLLPAAASKLRLLGAPGHMAKFTSI
eukprot:TRINITY_DN67051_c7_g8_i1.p1 TRINITY_DN67051_c7_g8~~TRINITY_DN67051_c7_g8_i1.p1  ORF type:complete len:1107 (-),score=80.49 TRINITY_DN67051_c7_g8_i1:699-4019(-)